MYNKKVLREATKNLNSTKAPAKKKDMIVDPMGQWKYPGQNTRIPGNDITMQGVPYPVWAVPNVGTPRMMYPEQDYYFPGADHVDEYPQMQAGGDISIPDLNQYEDGGEYDLTQEEIDDLIAQGYTVEDLDEYQTGGTKLNPEEEVKFQKFFQTLPDNLMDDDPSYDIRGYWDSEGKPAAFNYDQPKESDGFYHAYSINSNTGEYLKAPTHPTFQHAVTEDRKIGYRPITNVYGRNIAIENPSLIEPEAQSFLRNMVGPVSEYQYGGVSPLEGNLISNVIMNRNRGVDFVDRAYALGANPGTRMFNVPDDEEFGSYMSHKMATGEDDSGQTWMFPTVLNPNNEAIKVPNQYADYISSEGYKVATGMKQEGGFQDNIYTEYINKQPVTQSKRDMRISQKPNYHLEPMSITNPEKDRYWLTLSDRLKNLKSFIGGEDSTLKSGVSYQFQDGGTSLPGLEKVSDNTIRTSNGGLRVQQFAGQGTLDPKLQAIVDSWSQPKTVEYTPEKQCPEGYMYDYEKRDCVKIPKNSQLVDTQEEYDKLLKIYNEAKRRNDIARRYVKLENEWKRRYGWSSQRPVFENFKHSKDIFRDTQIPGDLSKVRLVNKNGEWQLINFPEWSEDQEKISSYLANAKKLGLTHTGRYSWIDEGEYLPEFKEVQPILKPGQIIMKPLPAVPIDMGLPKPELIPWTPPVVKRDRDVKVVPPETKEEWKTLPGTGTQYRVTRPVDPRFSREYNLRTGAYDNYAKGGFQDDINRRRKLLRDWTYGASIGMLHKAQEGKNIKTKFREAYPKGTIFTYKDNPDLINSTANFDMISNVEISPEYNEQIKQRLYTGNFGFDPNSGALVKLNKSQQKAIPQDIKDIRTKEKETAEEYKRQVKNENIKQQQELEYLGSMLEAGYDPGTFAGGFLPQKQEYKEYFDYGPRSTEELQNVPVENWTKEELDNWAREGHMAVMYNPLFKTAAYFTPEGIAIGAIDAAVNLLPDLYNRDYLSAAFDASMVLPFLPKGTLKNIRQGIGKGYETGKKLITPTISKEAATASSAPVKSGLGSMDMGMYEIKNPDYYTQLLNTYDNKMMPAANRKFYKDLINTVKKQNGLVTERQYMELKRLNTGNFNFGKKAYKKGGSLSKAQDGLAVMNYLINKGLTKEQAAGIAGNLQQESGFNPKAKSRSGYVGIAQWDPSNRWPAVKKYIMSQGYDPYSLEGQLEGLYWEANKRGDWKKIAQAQTPEQTGAAWLKHFEISGEKPGMSGYKSRMSYANKLASTYEPPMEKQVEFVIPPVAEFDTDAYRAEPIVEIGKLPTMPVQQMVQTMPLNGDVALMQTPLSTYDFGGETDYEDLDLTPEEIDWYLANGYELEDLGESETFDDYIPEAQEGLVFKNKTNVIPVKETVAPVKKPAVQQPVKQEPVKQQPVVPVRRELSPYEKIMAENMKRSIEFPDKKQITVQKKPVRKLPNKPKENEEFVFPALNLGSGAPPPSLTRMPSNQPIAGGLGSQFTNVGRAGAIDYNKLAQQQKEAKKSEAKSKKLVELNLSFPEKVQQVIGDTWQSVVDTEELIERGIERKMITYGLMDDNDQKVKVEDKPTPVDQYYKLPYGSQQVFNVNNANGRQYKQQTLPLSSLKLGYRNRGEYKDINTDGLEITTFDPFVAQPKNVKPNSSILAIDPNGNLHTGTWAELSKYKDKGWVYTKTFMNKVKSIDNNFLDGKRSGNRGYLQPQITTIDDKGNIKKGALNVLTKGKGKEDYYGSIQGGRVLFVDPKTKEQFLVSGSLNHIKSEFKRIKGNKEYLEVYTLDNGTYSRGLSYADKKLTKDRLKSYDNENTSGGNGLYIMDYKAPVYKYQQEIVKGMPNIRSKTDESYKKGHKLKNEVKNIVLHHTGNTDPTIGKKAIMNQYMKKGNNSSHVVIYQDGSRQVFASPEQVTFHAGASRYNNRENVNDFSVGVEFDGDTNHAPLTNAQIESFVEYYAPIAKKYNIKLKDIITHQMIRDKYLAQHKNEAKKVETKPDITKKEYWRILAYLKQKGYQ